MRPTQMKPLQVSAGRLQETLARLGEIGETPGGMQRAAFSAAEIEARSYVRGIMQEAGLDVRVDPGGNLIGSVAGSNSGLKPIAMGSHIDTVPQGGKYDGALGVIAGIEVCRTLVEKKIDLRHPLEVIAFTNEEGAFLNRGLLGSRAMAGLIEPGDLEAVDEEGKTYLDRLPSVGADPSAIEKAVRPKRSLAAYLELHIEQGPTLIDSGTQIGVVTGITGRAVFTIRLRGFQNHSGTTPMQGRRDAMTVAARVVLLVQQIAAEEKWTRVGTVGIVHCRPGAGNVIPGEVDLETEFRDLDMDKMAAAEKRLRELCAKLSDNGGVTIEIERTELEQATPCLPDFQETIGKVAGDLGFTTETVPSGAGHDAQAIAHITDIGMIFVPSVDGISHAPGEYTSPEDCARGADVLINVLLAIDQSRDA